MHREQTGGNSIKRLVVTAMLVAMEVVLSRFLSITMPLVKIGFGFLPIALIAMLYGPVYSGVAGAVADVLGALLFPVAPFFYGFTLSAFLNGAILGLFLYRDNTKLLRIAAAILLSSALVTLLLDTLWLSLVTPNPASVIFAGRFAKFAVMAPVQFVTISVIGNYFSGFIYKNSTPALKKAELRKEALKYYNGDFLSQREAISEAITRKVMALPEYGAAKTMFCYVGRKNEIDTAPLIEAALAEGKTVAVPYSEANGVMTARRITGLESLKRGRFGVLEPDENSEEVEPENIDVAIIPCLLCDLKGRRIGFGGGYYDRYLAQRRMIKIALCPEAMLKKRVANVRFDQRVDKVVY